MGLCANLCSALRAQLMEGAGAVNKSTPPSVRASSVANSAHEKRCLPKKDQALERAMLICSPLSKTKLSKKQKQRALVRG